MKVIDEISHRQMTRGEFLKVIGVAVIASFGVSNFFNAISKQHTTPSTLATSQRRGHGFGSSKFGA